MKKILKTVLITMIVMGLVTGGILFAVSRVGQSENKSEKKAAAEELDLLSEDGKKTEYDLTKSEPIKKESKTATLFDVSAQKVYDKAASLEIEKILNKKKRQRDYTFEAPMFAWNPFGTNNLSMYTYFETTEPVYIRYTIRVEDQTIPDFTRTLQNGETDNVTRNHQYQITGFVPGKTNYMIWNMYSRKGKLLETKIYSFEVPKLSSKAKTKLDSREGELLTKETQTNGLYYLLGEKYIELYDNSGVLRGELPLEQSKSSQVLFQNSKMIYAINKNAFASVNALGQVQDVWRFTGYSQEQFVYNGYGQILMIATKEGKERKTISDIVISLDLKSGKIKELLDFTKVLPKFYKIAQQQQKKSGKKKNTEKKLDWISLTSLVSTSSDGVIVSSKNTSSILRINSISSVKPKIAYIIGEESKWSKTPYKKYLYAKQGQNELEEEVKATAEAEEKIVESNVKVPDVFPTQYEQTYVEMKNDTTLGESSYYLYVFNTNHKPQSTWCQYLIDEDEGTYNLEDSVEVPYCRNNGSFYDKEANRIYTLPENGSFMERDKENKDIRIFELPSSCVCVKKYDMKGFWYQ